MENWNIGFWKPAISDILWPTNPDLYLFVQFLRTHHSMIPLFHYSDFE